MALHGVKARQVFMDVGLCSVHGCDSYRWGGSFLFSARSDKIFEDDGPLQAVDVDSYGWETNDV